MSYASTRLLVVICYGLMKEHPDLAQSATQGYASLLSSNASWGQLSHSFYSLETSTGEATLKQKSSWGNILAFNQVEGSWYANFGSDIVQVNLSLILTMKLSLVHSKWSAVLMHLKGRFFPKVVLRIFKPAAQAIAILAARLLLQSQWDLLLGDVDNSDII